MPQHLEAHLIARINRGIRHRLAQTGIGILPVHLEAQEPGHVVDPGAVVAEAIRLDPEIVGQVACRVLDVVAQADHLLRGKGLVNGPGEDAHRVDVVQQHRIRAELAHVTGQLHHEGNRPQAAEDAADADGVGDGLLQAVFFRNVELRNGRLRAADQHHVDDEVGAGERGAAAGMLLDAASGAELLRGPACHHAGGLEAFGVDVVQRDDNVAQLGIIEDVRQQVPGEDHAAGADHRDPGHPVGSFACGAQAPGLDSQPDRRLPRPSSHVPCSELSREDGEPR